MTIAGPTLVQRDRPMRARPPPISASQVSRPRWMRCASAPVLSRRRVSPGSQHLQAIAAGRGVVIMLPGRPGKLSHGRWRPL